MTVAHKDLTGTDLHEIKGASAAAAGTVPVADGAGGAPFGKLSASSLTGTANPFGAQLVHFTEEQNTGVASVTSGAPGWNSVVFNTVRTIEIPGVNLSTGNITLPAGTYFIEASAPVYLSATGATFTTGTARLFNQTTGAGIITGQPIGLFLSTNVNTVQAQMIVGVSGRFTLGSTSVVSLQTFSTNSAGFSPRPSGLTVEVYGNVKIWKVA